VYIVSLRYTYIDEMHVVNLTGLTTWNQTVISSEKNKLALRLLATIIQIQSQRNRRHPYKLHYKYLLINDASISGNVVRTYFIYYQKTFINIPCNCLPIE